MRVNSYDYEQLLGMAHELSAGMPPVLPSRGINNVVIEWLGYVIPKERARKTKSGSLYTPKSTRDFEANVKATARTAMNAAGMEAPLAMPVLLDITIGMKFPDSWPDWKCSLAFLGMIHTKNSDVDNKCKAILDALNGVVYMDDKQGVRLAAWDKYADEDYFRIVVTPCGLTTDEVTRLERIMREV